ncbi:MAG TPA: hypothetical protein VHU61_06475, partial [Solirubrobacteraceae bacterium]|nr:hypothetical protein [Solirubrobacteraceae bacterium]
MSTSSPGWAPSSAVARSQGVLVAQLALALPVVEATRSAASAAPGATPVQHNTANTALIPANRA